MVTLFLLGRPGSGKSKVARSLKEALSDTRHVVHLTDYWYLLDRFKKEERSDLAFSRRKFKPSLYGGFEVIAFDEVFPEALQQINRCILSLMNDPRMLILVEFARNTYQKEIWEAFDRTVIDTAYCLYLQADLETCIKRIRERTDRNEWEDDTFVPDHVMRTYYRSECATSLQETFLSEKIQIIDNNGNWDATWIEVQSFIDEISARQIVIPAMNWLVNPCLNRSVFSLPSVRPLNFLTM